jgi:hypothetical protein
VTPFNRKRIVEPLDQPGIEAGVERQFVDAGWPAEDARWLTELCLGVRGTRRFQEAGSDPEVDHILRLVARSWVDAKPTASRNGALLVAFARLIDLGGAGAPPFRLESTCSAHTRAQTRALAKQLAGEFRKHAADFEGGLVEGGWPGTYDQSEIEAVCRDKWRDGDHREVHGVPEVHLLIRALVEDAKLDLSRVIDQSALHAAGVARTGHLGTPPVWRAPKLNRFEVERIAPRALTTWMFELGPTALAGLRDALAREPNDELCATLAIGIQDSIERWINSVVQHWTYFAHFGTALADVTEPLMLELEQRLTANPENRLLRQAWIWFARVTAEADPERIPDDRCDRILLVANEELATLRKLLARARPKSPQPVGAETSQEEPKVADEVPPWVEFECAREHFETCAVVLFDLGNLWTGMKPLLLAMRSLACPAVSSDLRYWGEKPIARSGEAPKEFEQPPDPWAAIPTTMINLFHGFARFEQADDPQLEKLRGDLAAFCLRGLADRWTKAEREDAEKRGMKRTNENMLERSPDWRYCLIRAAMALNINPEGKGHRILHTASQIDPDPEVRAVAREAYEKFRRARGVPEDVSPRRMIMTALWWVRQAHLLALDVEIDADGAQRTRVKELTRTKEMERTDKEELD